MRDVRTLSIVLMLVSSTFLMTTPVSAQITDSDGVLSSKHDGLFDVSISKTEKQWGQYLRATLRYQGKQSLEKIDLLPWQEQVAITREDVTTDKDEDGNIIQTLNLRLNPRLDLRGTGQFQLAPLRLGSLQSRPIDISISPAKVKNSEVKLNWQISSKTPWQREAVIVKVQLQTEAQDAHVKLDASTSKRYISRALKTERHVLADGSYLHSAGWIIHPIDPGKQMLDLPPVRYQVAASDLRRFFLPIQRLEVKALPTYLPPTLPVGQLSVRSHISADAIDTKQWQLQIETDALIPYGIPELDTQLAASSNQSIADIEIKYSKQSDYANYGDRSLYTVKLPDWLMPFGKALKLRLRYFDTEVGRLDEITHTLPRNWNMPTWAWWLFSIIVLMVVALAAKLLQPLMQSQINRSVLRQQLRSATNVKQMKKHILGSGRFIALTDWAVNNRARKPVIDELNYYCYSNFSNGGGEVDIEKLRSELLKSA